MTGGLSALATCATDKPRYRRHPVIALRHTRVPALVHSTAHMLWSRATREGIAMMKTIFLTVMGGLRVRLLH